MFGLEVCPQDTEHLFLQVNRPDLAALSDTPGERTGEESRPTAEIEYPVTRLPVLLRQPVRAVEEPAQARVKVSPAPATISGAANVVPRWLARVEELSRADQLAVARARKLERLFSQPFTVTMQFTSMEGKYVPVEETVRSCKEICQGKWDHLPEMAFMYIGVVDEAKDKIVRK